MVENLALAEHARVALRFELRVQSVLQGGALLFGGGLRREILHAIGVGLGL